MVDFAINSKKYCSIFATVYILTLLQSFAALQAEDYCYYHFKERVLIRRRLDEYAVLTSPNITGEIASLSAEGANRKKVFGNWEIVQIADDPAGGKSVSSAMSQLGSDSRIEFATPVFSGLSGEGFFFVTPELMIGFREEVTHETARGILGRYDLVILEEDYGNMLNVYLADSGLTDGLEVLDLANSLAQLEEIVFAESNMISSGKSDLMPNDPLFEKCWGIHQDESWGLQGGVYDVDMDGPEAWEITTGDPNTIVMILDDGVQQDHPDLNQIPGSGFTYDNSPNGEPYSEWDNHGTSVAGCVSARINNGLGAVGIAPDCRIVSARVHTGTDESGFHLQYSWVVNALTWAESIGVRITNNSNSYSIRSSTIDSIYNQTYERGMIHFASSGNEAEGVINYPSELASVNSVANLNLDGQVSSSSNWGEGLAFAAPGRSIYTTDRTGLDGSGDGDYRSVNGTSFASPYAAGVAALILSHNPALTAVEVEQIMQISAKDLGERDYDTEYGWGLVNAHNALLYMTGEPFCKRNPTGDFNYDCIVDMLDESLLAGSWLKNGSVIFRPFDQVDPSGDPIGHWPFDVDANDVVGPNHGIIYGNPAFVDNHQAIVGAGAVEYHGNPDGMAVPSAALTTNSWTLSVWEYSADDQMGGYLFGSGNPEGWEALYFRRWGDRYSGGVVYNKNDEKIFTPSLLYPRYKWHMVTLTHDGTEDVTRLYVDGLLTAFMPDNHFVEFDEYIYIGGRKTHPPGDDSRYFIGKLDDLRFYNYPLSENEVAHLYVNVTGGRLCVHPPIADLNGDCQVGLCDFAILASSWLSCGIYPNAECF